MPRNDLKAYTSLIARIPQDLADQVKRYASEHRCTISELIRDGLEMRLEEDSPWHAPGESHDAESEVLPEVIHGMDALTPILHALVRETVRATMSEVLQEVLHRETSRQAAIPEVIPPVIPDGVEVLHGVLPSGEQVLPGHTSPLQAPSDATNGGITKVIPQKVLPGHTSADMERAQEGGGTGEVLPFDTTRYRLGKLCPRGHDYQGTGQSLLRTHNQRCRECENESRREKRQGRRQGQAPEQRPGGVLPDTVLPYDPTTRRLGKLCPRGHDYLGTGQSLRTTHKSGYCLACNAERIRERRQATAL